MMWGCSCVRVSGITALLILAGCATQEGEMLFSFAGESKPPAADPDACGTPQDCAAHLKRLVKESNRDWIGVPQSPDGYSNGTRFFAYRALRKKLTCSELQRAVEDARAAMTSLDAPPYDRARGLAGEVTRELTTEQAKRCSRPS
jgi:hypothetical protein